MFMVQSILVLKIILNTIRENIKITRLELSKKIDRSQRTVQRITNSLVDKGFIERICNNRFGYWEVK
jgi:predicted transcriptional regulator